MWKRHSKRNGANARFGGVLATVGCVAWLTHGCAVGPDYRQPDIGAPGPFRNAPANASTNSLADLPWWELYRDETLSALIRAALTNNHDLRIAMARVEQSRAIARQARAQFLPQADYEGDVSRGRNEFLGSPSPAGPAGAQTGDALFAGLSAAWEIDLWVASAG